MSYWHGDVPARREGGYLLPRSLTRTRSYADIVKDYVGAVAAEAKHWHLVVAHRFVRLRPGQPPSTLSCSRPSWRRSQTSHHRTSPRSVGNSSSGSVHNTKRADESVDRFRQRINKRAREDGWRLRSPKTEKGWLFGSAQQQKPGSLHTDIWTGPAVDLASKGAIAVYPVAGWWQYRRAWDQSDEGVDYSLVVSIDTPDVNIDLWTPVSQQIRPAVEISTYLAKQRRACPSPTRPYRRAVLGTRCGCSAFVPTWLRRM